MTRCWHRLWLTSCWRCRTVAYLNLVISRLPASPLAGNATRVRHFMADVPGAGGPPSSGRRCPDTRTGSPGGFRSSSPGGPAPGVCRDTADQADH